MKQKMKFLGRHLMLKGTYIDSILNGEKKATIRKGIYRLKHGEVMIHAGGRPIAKAKITRVYYKRLGELGDLEARIEGFNSREELLGELRKVYGKLREDEYFTIIEFEVIQRLDKLPIGDPYYGLQPADVARIAMRYIKRELSDQEIRVLEDITKTNSIRKTAVNIFGDINKRFLIRRILRKTTRLLLEKGLVNTGDKTR